MSTLMGYCSASRQYAKRALALALIITGWILARPEQTPAEKKRELSSHYRFNTIALPVAPNVRRNSVRDVNPSLKPIQSWVSAVGAAASLADLDGDGLPNDLCHIDPRTDTIVIAPLPGTGQRYLPVILDPKPLRYDAQTMAPMGCLPVDLNEDGRMDLVAYFWGRTPLAFFRSEEKHYVPSEIMPDEQRWYTNAATSADLDGDGHVDLVFGNYFADAAKILDSFAENVESMPSSMSRAYNGGQKHFLLWKRASMGIEPAVQFEEIHGVVDHEVDHGWTFAVGAADLDGDLLPEIYFSHDFGPDRLLYNRSMPGRLEFTKLEGQRDLWSPASKVLGQDSFKGMGVDFGDLNGDTLFDIYVSNIAAEFSLLESHFAFVSTGELALMRKGIAPYVDRSEELGLSRSGWGWDSKLIDLNNDGVLEAVQALGYIKGTVNRWPELHELATINDSLLADPRSWPYFQPGCDLSGHQRNAFFAWDGERYADIADEVGLGEAQVGRGIASADVDGDGDVDLVFANQWENSYFHQNECPQCGTFLGLHLRLPISGQEFKSSMVQNGHPSQNPPGRPAIGALAMVYLSDGRRLVAQVDGGNGHSGKRSPDLQFGLGDHPSHLPVRVEIRYRGSHGDVRKEAFVLTPEWHTIYLSTLPFQGEKP